MLAALEAVIQHYTGLIYSAIYRHGVHLQFFGMQGNEVLLHKTIIVREFQ